MIIWNSSFFPALYSSCSELNHKKIQYCSSSGLSRLCSSSLDLRNFPLSRKILKWGKSSNEDIRSRHRLLWFIINTKRITAGLNLLACLLLRLRYQYMYLSFLLFFYLNYDIMMISYNSVTALYQNVEEEKPQLKGQFLFENVLMMQIEDKIFFRDARDVNQAWPDVILSSLAPSISFTIYIPSSHSSYKEHLKSCPPL